MDYEKHREQKGIPRILRYPDGWRGHFNSLEKMVRHTGRGPEDVGDKDWNYYSEITRYLLLMAERYFPDEQSSIYQLVEKAKQSELDKIRNADYDYFLENYPRFEDMPYN